MEPKRDVSISASVLVSKQFLSNILTNFAENCPEALNWAGDDSVDVMRIAEGETWLEPLSVIRIRNLRYDRKEDNEGDRKGVANLDLAAIAIGLNRALVYPNLRADIRGDILQAVIEDDAGYIDSERGDIIAQLAIFGEVVYG